MADNKVLKMIDSIGKRLAQIKSKEPSEDAPKENQLDKLDKEKLGQLAKSFKFEFDKNESNRMPQELEWMQSLRQVKGKYDPEAEQRFEANEHKVHPQYTRSKTAPLLAKLNNMVPENEKDWEILPTPMPHLSKKDLNDIAKSLVTQGPDGMPVMPTPIQVSEAVGKFAAKKCGNMSTLISDQLLDDGYRNKIKEVKRSGVWFGTGILKGPLSEMFTTAEYATNEKGEWEQSEKNRFRPSGDVVPIWRWFPDTSSTELSKCNYVYELHSMTKHEMRKLAERDDFIGDSILEILKQKPEGDYKLRTWEIQLQTEGQINQTDRMTQNYEILERNGWVDGHDLWRAGVITEDKADLEYFCNVWQSGDKIIKITVWPDYMQTLDNLYHVFYYDKDETSIFGTGLPKIIRDTHLAIAACARAMLRNAAWVSGPIGEVNATLLSPEQAAKAADMHPGKFYVRTVRSQDANIPVMRTYSIESRINDFIALKHEFEAQGDLESSLPSALFGMPERNTDVSPKALALRMQNLIDFIKNIIKNFDDANTSFIRSVYQWNMKYHEDESVKGDMMIRAVGSANVIVKEMFIEHISFLMQSLPDDAKKYFKFREFMLESLKKDFPQAENFLRTETEVAEMEKAQQSKQDEIMALQTELSKIKGEYDKAKAEHMLAKAEKTRAAIPHDTEEAAIDNETKKLKAAQTAIDMNKSVQDMQHAEREHSLETEKAGIENAAGIVELGGNIAGLTEDANKPQAGEGE